MNSHSDVMKSKNRGMNEDTPRITGTDTILSLGSCFSTEMSQRLAASGYRVLDNPFGVLFNPVSIARALEFLAEGHTFTPEDVIPRDTNPVRKPRPTGNIVPDAGYVSFYHHGSFVRESPEEFLEHANASLRDASSWFRSADWLIITFGTAWVYRHIERDFVVSNCHKHPAWEFRREKLDVGDIVSLWLPIVERFPEKRFIFTVSPIRHKKDGMHGNQLSKATLLLAVDRIISLASGDNAQYFPSYEIVLDELRDYSWFKDDQVHPSEAAIDIVWQRFRSTTL